MGPEYTGASIDIKIATENNKLFIYGPHPTPTSKVKKFELIPESSTSFFNIEAGLEIKFTNKNGFTLFNRFNAQRTDVTEEEFMLSDFASQSHTAKKILQAKKSPSSTAHTTKKLGIDLHSAQQIKEKSPIETKAKSVEKFIKKTEDAIDERIQAKTPRRLK
jgi:hypothetical protein